MGCNLKILAFRFTTGSYLASQNVGHSSNFVATFVLLLCNCSLMASSEEDSTGEVDDRSDNFFVQAERDKITHVISNVLNNG